MPPQIASSLATYQRTDMQCREEGVAAQLEVVNPFSGGMNGKIFGPCHNEYRYGTDDAKLLEVWRDLLMMQKETLTPLASVPTPTLMTYTRQSSLHSGE